MYAQFCLAARLLRLGLARNIPRGKHILGNAAVQQHLIISFYHCDGGRALKSQSPIHQ